MKRYGKRNKKYSSIVALTVAVSLLLSGCALRLPFTGDGNGGTGEQEPLPETLGLVPDFSYERKEEKPGILTDRLGYLPYSVKTAVFQGKELPETFQVMEKDSGRCVYEGKIRRGESGADGIVTGYGTFTEVKEEGNYYIRCDKIGCSYYISIGDSVYLEKAKELGRLIEETKQGDGAVQETMDICETLSYLLAAYEMYPGLFLKIWESPDTAGNEAGINGEKFFEMLRAQTDILITSQDEKTGGVYKEAKTMAAAGQEGQIQPEVSPAATAVYAGTMAKYGYLYQEYDWDYANICLKAAAKAWRYLEKEEKRGGFYAEDVATGRIYAASELYRASNERVYHNYMLQNSELLAGGKEDVYLLMGKVTYLSTRREVDHELCGEIMSGLMKEAERTAAEGKSETFLVVENETDVILWNMTALALTNYAIMNHEYVTVIENHLHYLMGRNGESALLLEEPDSVEAAKLLLLFGVVEAERKIIEESMEEESA